MALVGGAGVCQSYHRIILRSRSPGSGRKDASRCEESLASAGFVESTRFAQLRKRSFRRHGNPCDAAASRAQRWLARPVHAGFGAAGGPKARAANRLAQRTRVLALLHRGSASPPRPTLRSCLRELDDHLDVSRLTLESTHEMLGPFAPGDEPTEPRAIRSCQHLRCLVPVSSVRVHTADDDVVLEHHGSGDICGEARRAASAADARQADDSAGTDAAWRQSAMTWPTPVHSTMTSGLKPTSVARPAW